MNLKDKILVPRFVLIFWGLLFLFFTINSLTQLFNDKKPKMSKYDTQEYSSGFRDGMECIALTSLETSIINERKTFGELMNICIERNKIKEK